jgi:hypothetical protein
MNNQTLILIGVGLFVGLVVTIAAVEHYLLSEHDPLEPSGLIWRVETAFSRIKDLEAVLEVTGGEGSGETVRMLVRFKNGPEIALSVRYLDPASVRDELFTVDRDLLSHYLPQENLLVIKRWVGLPLAALGLASFDLSSLEKDWRAGKVKLRVLREVSGSSGEEFPSSLRPLDSFAGLLAAEPFSLCCGFVGGDEPHPGLSEIEVGSGLGTVQGGFILEATDVQSGRLTRRVWVDRETFLVTKVASFSDGKRTSTIGVERITLDQGLSAEEILAVPRGAETIRG